MKDTFYFQHDYNARTDTKVRRLLAKHGMAGYGIFWAIVEDLYNNENELKMTPEEIAYDFRVENDVVLSILNDFDLFVVCDGCISSKSIANRLTKREEKSIKSSESARKRWLKNDGNANAMRTHNERNAIKGKERKEKEKEINIPFDHFWEAYGNKKDKVKSEAKWLKLTDEQRQAAMLDIPKYIASLSDRKYQKYPLTYLSGECWNDDHEPILLIQPPILPIGRANVNKNSFV